MPVTNASGPLAQLIGDARLAIGECLVGGPRTGPSPQETIDQVAGGLLAAMGMGEIASDLDVRGVALLGVAAVAGLQKIGMQEPSITRLDSALYALEDLLRRSAAVNREG